MSDDSAREHERSDAAVNGSGRAVEPRGQQGTALAGIDIDHADDGDSIARWGHVSPELGAELERVAGAIGDAAIEHVHALFLDPHYRLIASETMATGTASSAPCDAQTILRRAVVLEAAQMILLHNHPVGGTRPSEADIAITDRLAEGGQALGIALVDHLILAQDRCFSLMRSGLASTRPPRPLRLGIADFARVVVRIEQRKLQLPAETRAVVGGAGWSLACALYFEARPVSLAELTTLAGVERTIAVRWLLAMDSAKLIVVRPSPSEAGFMLVELSEAGVNLIDDLTSTTFASGPDRATLRSAPFARPA